jgi:exodeoxyribonuclease-5
LQLELLKYFPFEPTKDQSLAIEKIEDFYWSLHKRSALVLKGYAGTGKTTLIGALVEALKSKNIPIVLMAPTGRAAKVMSNYSNHIATTIHRGIYLFDNKSDGIGFSLKRNLMKNAFIIIDESSMIASSGGLGGSFLAPGQTLLNDLCRFTFNGSQNKILFVGDDAQLPPVGSDKSPALQPDFLERELNIVASIVHLKEVTRQSQESKILYNANKLRLQIQNESIEVPKFECNDSDFKAVENFEIEEEIQSSYSLEGLEETIIICRSNRDANQLNQYVRFQMLGREGELDAGDRLMVVKNNYYWLKDYESPQFIANGEMIEVVKIGEIEEKYGLRFCNATARLNTSDFEFETKLLLDVLNNDGPTLSKEQFLAFLGELEKEMPYPNNQKERKIFLKEHSYYNALQVKFGYAITCHKAQGGQWNHVFFMQGYFTDDHLDKSYLRWLYTGITRAKQKLFLINFHPDFISR